MLPALALLAATLTPWLTEMASWCDDLRVPDEISLAIHDDTPLRVEVEGPSLWVAPTGMRSVRHGPLSLAQLGPWLDGVRERAMRVGDGPDAPYRGLLHLFVDGAVDAVRVQEILDEARKHGVNRVRFAVATRQGASPAPDPEFAATLARTTEGLRGPERRAALYSAATVSESRCDAMAEMMVAVQRIPHAQSCSMLVQTLDQSTTDCTEAQARQTFTALYMDHTPLQRLSHWDLDAQASLPAPEGTWATWSVALRAAAGKTATAAVEVEESREVLGLLGADGRYGGLIGAKGVQIGQGGLANGATAEGLGGLGSQGTAAAGYGRSGTATAEMGSPTIVGRFDGSVIEQVIHRKMSQIRYCYHRDLAKDPTLSGRVVIAFTIGEDGRVSTSTVTSSTLNHAPVESCVAARFFSARFPAPEAGAVKVTIPFRFAPGEPAQ